MSKQTCTRIRRYRFVKNAFLLAIRLFSGLELGIADQNLQKAIAHSTGRTVAQIKADAQAAGDLGIVAEQSRANQRMIFQPAPLNVRGVFDKLKEIARMTGHAVSHILQKTLKELG